MESNTITFTDDEMQKIRQYKLDIENICDLVACRMLERSSTEDFIKLLIDLAYEYAFNNL